MGAFDNIDYGDPASTALFAQRLGVQPSGAVVPGTADALAPSPAPTPGMASPPVAPPGGGGPSPGPPQDWAASHPQTMGLVNGYRDQILDPVGAFVRGAMPQGGPPLDSSDFAPGVAAALSDLPAPPGGAVSVPRVSRPAAPAPAPVASGAPAPVAGPGVGPAPWLTREMGEQRPQSLDQRIASDNREMTNDFDVAGRREHEIGWLKSGELMDIAEQRAAYQKLVDAHDAINQKADQDAQAQHATYMAQTSEMADKLAKTRIDTSRVFHNQSAGDKLMFVIGAGIGGALEGAGLTRGNTFLDNANKIIDRDVQAQLTDLDTQRAGIGQRNTMLSQFMAQNGDRRLAAAQTRLNMLDSLGRQVQETADRYGSGLAKQNAAKMQEGIVAEQHKAQAGVDAEAKRAALANAAAAANAMKAAENERYKRSMEMAKLGIEKQNADTARMREQGGGSDGRKELNQETRTLAKELSNPETLNTRAAVQNLYAQIPKRADGSIDIDNFQGFDGIGPGANLREAVAPPAGSAPGQTALGALLSPVIPGGPLLGAAQRAAALGPNARTNRQDWEANKSYLRKAITGSGMSDRERANLNEMIDGALTPAEQANTVVRVMGALKEGESAIRAGASDEARAEYDRRQKAER